MEYGAIDLHKKESQVRIMTEGGDVIDRRVATTRERLTTLFWGRPHSRILIEASHWHDPRLAGSVFCRVRLADARASR